jgi:hypothetical protein
MPSGTAQLALSAAAFTVVLGRRVPAAAPELSELAAAGALVRRGRELLVDPALQAALAVWQHGAVRMDVVIRDRRGALHLGASAQGQVGVCVVSGPVAGRLVEPVHVLVPGAAGLVVEVVARVPWHDQCAPAAVWARVRGRRTAWFVLCRDDGSGWQRVLPAPPAFGVAVRHEPVDGEGLARVLTVALAGALEEDAAAATDATAAARQKEPAWR